MRLRCGLALIMATSLAGCGVLANSRDAKDDKPEMDMREAARYADEVISGTMGAVVPPVRWAHGTSTDGVCEGGAPAGTGSVTRRAAITTDVSSQRRGSLLGVIERHWKKRGDEITEVRKHKESPAMFATTPDAFRMSLVVGYQGQVFIDVVTPCMTRSEVPPPGARPGVPDYTGRKPPLPDEHSDFWSDRAPVPGKG